MAEEVISDVIDVDIGAEAPAKDSIIIGAIILAWVLGIFG